MHSASALGALSSHRFLVRAAFAAGLSFAWVFVMQYFYAATHSVAAAFVHTIVLYALAQVITALTTPYSAVRIASGTKRLMVFGILCAAVGFSLLGAALSAVLPAVFGLIGFAIFLGVYRAIYWVPYLLERDNSDIHPGLTQEVFIALMPAIAGYALFNGTMGALALVVATVIILVASLSPLWSVTEIYERFSWSYSKTFAELFEPKYNPIVESAFLEGMQGTALLLLWPLSVFLIVGSSYRLLGLVLTFSLLLAIPLRHFGAKLVHGKTLLHATLAASAWIMRMAVATPFGVILVDTYAAAGGKGNGLDPYAQEQSADNGSYVDELTAIKEISLCIGRLVTCAIAGICISFFTLAAGLAVTFLIAAAASAIAVIEAKKRTDF